MDKYNIDQKNLSYEAVGCRSWDNIDFLDDNLLQSAKLFTPDSLFLRKPEPKEFDVVAILSGIEFSPALQTFVTSIQLEIDSIINGAMRYWVKPENLGVEYCVLKWPDDPWSPSRAQSAIQIISEASFATFNLLLKGIQVNQDGCVIVKGYDQGDSLRILRGYFRDHFDGFPKKQSSWSHIPIGRILEPIGVESYKKLKDYVDSSNDRSIIYERISKINLVHERVWYMEKKEIIYARNSFD